MTQAKKAVILARVSTDEQEEFSPEAQTNRMQSYCEYRDLQVLEEYQITESSTKGGRVKFMEVIDAAKKLARKHKEPVALVTDKIDRLQRSFNEQSLLEKLRLAGLLEYHFSSDNCVIHKDSPAKDLFMWNIGIALAQNYTDSLRDNVKRAIEQKLKDGEWIGQAPIGYLNKRDEHKRSDGRGKAHVVIDPIRAPLVRQLFEKYATGCYSISEIVKYAKELGLTNPRGKHGPLIKSHIHKILQEPFYYGVMRVKKTGEEYPHKYDTVISKALFDKCQQVRTGRGNPHARYGKKEFLFRGILTCAHSGKLCTAQKHTKKYKNGGTGEFTYVISYDKDNPGKKYFTREDDVIAQVEEALNTLTIDDDELLGDVVSHVRKAHDAKKYDHKQSLIGLKKEHGNLQEKIDKLTDLRLEGELTKGEFMQQKKKLKDRQYELVEMMHAYDLTDDQFINKLIYMIELSANALKYFRGSSLDEKRELLNLVFLNLKLNGKNLEYTMAKPFEIIAECNKTGTWCPLEDVIRTCKETRILILSMPYLEALPRIRYSNPCLGHEANHISNY